MTQLKISDEDQASGFAIYRTQVNKAALGDALDDDYLLRLVRDHGDAEGSLKFLVCNPHARVQEPLLLTSPVRSIPPPPSVFGPLVPRSKPAKSSRQESISSEDPTPDTGYEPSAISDDFEDTEHRNTMRPPQYIANLPNLMSAPQASRYDNRQPPSPASAKLPYSADRRRFYDADYNQGTFLPTSHSAPASEDVLSPPRQHVRRGSAAQDTEQIVRDSERITDHVDVEWPRNQSSPLGALSKLKFSQRFRGNPSTSDDLTTERRDIRALSPRDPESGNGHRSSSTGVGRSSSSRRKPPRLEGPPLSTRLLQPPRKGGGKLAPAHHIIAWKASDSPTASNSSKTLKNVKSMDTLKAIPLSPTQLLRASPSRPQLSSSLNVGSSIVTRPLEPVPRPPRPLPPTQGPAVECVSSESGQTTRPFLQPSPAISTNSAAYLSPTQDPYPRPQSTSPSQRYPKPIDGPPEPSRERELPQTLVGMHHQSHSSGSISKFGEIPFREDGYSGPTLPASLRPGGYGSATMRPYGTSDTPPRSPVSNANSKGTSANSSTFSYSSTGTMVPSRQPSSGQDTLSESTLRPDERDKMIWDLKTRIAMETSSQVDSSLKEDSVGSNDSYGTATEDLWSRRPISQMVPDGDTHDFDLITKSSPRPALNVVTQDSVTNVRGVPPNFPPPPDYIPQLQPQSRQPRTPRPGLKGSTFEESTWAHRPPPEDVYERLEEFFPEHDVDKPIIDATSGGTSPTATEPPSGIPPDDRERITGVRGKKSIRIVAEEHKKRIDRTSRAETAFNANMIRKRSTKLWGGRLEEVTSSQKKPTYTKSLPESPSGGPRRMLLTKLIRDYANFVSSYLQMGTWGTYRQGDLWPCVSCPQCHHMRDDRCETSRDPNHRQR